MISLSDRYRKRSGTIQPLLFVAIAGCWMMPTALAQELHSVSVDRINDRMVVRGDGFDGSTTFTLGGAAVATVNVTPTELDIPFDIDVAAAAQWRGSYRLVANDSVWISVYIAAPIDAPGEPPPPPPPPPPPGGTECPCLAGWEASGIPKDNWAWCTRYFDGTQESLSAPRDPWFISVAHDPYNLFFDPVDPGNSVSYCALHDGTDWTVAEPVVNRDQFDDCEHWMWMNICI
jgi:hypothetical protein